MEEMNKKINDEIQEINKEYEEASYKLYNDIIQ